MDVHMRILPDKPLHITLHARERMRKRCGDESDGVIRDVFARGRVVLNLTKGLIDVIHDSLVLVIKDNGDHYSVVTVITPAMRKRARGPVFKPVRSDHHDRRRADHDEAEEIAQWK